VCRSYTRLNIRSTYPANTQHEHQHSLLVAYLQLERQLYAFATNVKTLRGLATECQGRISRYGRRVAEHYLKQWFRAYLATKDEQHLCWTGEVRRDYQLDGMEAFRHTRAGESKLYQDAAVLLMCSFDGVNYAYRALSHGASEKLQDKLDDRVITRVDMLEVSYKKHVEELDKTCCGMEACLRKAGASLADVGTRPMLEFISTEFPPTDEERWEASKANGGEGVDAVPLRLRLERRNIAACSRSEALSTTLDDPDGLVEVSVSRAKPGGAGGGGVARRRNWHIVADSDDDESQERAEADKAAFVEAEAMGREVNVNAIKRDLGFDPRKLQGSHAAFHMEGDEDFSYDDGAEEGGGDGGVDGEGEGVAITAQGQDRGWGGETNTCASANTNIFVSPAAAAAAAVAAAAVDHKTDIYFAFADVMDPVGDYNVELLLRVKVPSVVYTYAPVKVRARGHVDLRTSSVRWCGVALRVGNKAVPAPTRAGLSVAHVLDQVALEMWSAVPCLPVLPVSITLHPHKQTFGRGETLTLVGDGSRVNCVVNCVTGDDAAKQAPVLVAMAAARECTMAVPLCVALCRRVCRLALLWGAGAAYVGGSGSDSASGSESGGGSSLSIDLSRNGVPDGPCLDLRGQGPALAAGLLAAGLPPVCVTLTGQRVDGALLASLVGCGARVIRATGCGLTLEDMEDVAKVCLRARPDMRQRLEWLDVGYNALFTDRLALGPVRTSSRDVIVSKLLSALSVNLDVGTLALGGRGGGQVDGDEDGQDKCVAREKEKQTKRRSTLELPTEIMSSRDQALWLAVCRALLCMPGLTRLGVSGCGGDALGTAVLGAGLAEGLAAREGMITPGQAPPVPDVDVDVRAVDPRCSLAVVAPGAVKALALRFPTLSALGEPHQ